MSLRRESGPAQPIDRTVTAHQSGSFAVVDHRIVFDFERHRMPLDWSGRGARATAFSIVLEPTEMIVIRYSYLGLDHLHRHWRDKSGGTIFRLRDQPPRLEQPELRN